MNKFRSCRRKIKTIGELEKLAKKLKKNGKKIVLCTGVFDLVHPGHIDYFEKAGRFADIIVVSVVDNKFVTKGYNRPIFDEKLRLWWLAGLEAVDYVVLNGDYGPHEIMRRIKPDFFVKGEEDKIKLKDPNSGISKDKRVMDEIGGQVRFIKELTHSTDIFNFINKKLFQRKLKNKLFTIRRFYSKN